MGVGSAPPFALWCFVLAWQQTRVPLCTRAAVQPSPADDFVDYGPHRRAKRSGAHDDTFTRSLKAHLLKAITRSCTCYVLLTVSGLGCWEGTEHHRSQHQIDPPGTSYFLAASIPAFQKEVPRAWLSGWIVLPDQGQKLPHRLNCESHRRGRFSGARSGYTHFRCQQPELRVGQYDDAISKSQGVNTRRVDTFEVENNIFGTLGQSALYHPFDASIVRA